MSNQDSPTLIGPFSEIVTMRNLPVFGALKDDSLEIITLGGLLVQDGTILEIGSYKDLLDKRNGQITTLELIKDNLVAFPGFIDAHTHICFGGSRAMDFAARNAGKSYLEIGREGGGIWSTVKHTREATQEELIKMMTSRIARLLRGGVTTVEVKSGYGLSVEAELKMLRAIKAMNSIADIDLISTCLAAHIIPKDFEGGERAYLDQILTQLVPIVKEERLCNRFDIFVEENAFSTEEAKRYLTELKEQGFELTVHGDQFSPGGSKVAIECGALSVDHLEASRDQEIDQLAQSKVIPMALPGASIGLGCAFTPARKLLDKGCSLAIASDWNPGSAPMGELLTQASILATFEKLSSAEVFAGITFRAAEALGLKNVGQLEVGFKADIATFNCSDYREVLYQQGSLKATNVWKAGVKIL